MAKHISKKQSLNFPCNKVTASIQQLYVELEQSVFTNGKREMPWALLLLVE